MGWVGFNTVKTYISMNGIKLLVLVVVKVEWRRTGAELGQVLSPGNRYAKQTGVCACGLPLKCLTSNSLF